MLMDCNLSANCTNESSLAVVHDFNADPLHEIEIIPRVEVPTNNAQCERLLAMRHLNSSCPHNNPSIATG